MNTPYAPKWKIAPSICLAALFALSVAQAQNIIGVGVPTGTTRNDTYVAAGFEFYAPTGGTTINALGFWDQSGTGLLAPHTVSIFRYNNTGSQYVLLATATIPPGTTAPLINGYRWVGIPTLALPNNGQGGGYYAILANQTQDTWANSIGSAPYLNPAIGTVSGQGLIVNNSTSTVLSSLLNINGTGNPNQGFGGPNLGYLTNQLPASVPAAQIVWDAEGTFTDNTVLGLAGAPSNEVYGVDFGGSGLQTTTNGYTFNDYTTSGNMTLGGSLSSYNAYLSGGGTTGDSGFDALLNSGIYGNQNIYGILNNLTVGQRYHVIMLGADTRGSTAQFRVTDHLTYSPAQTFCFPGGTPAIGGYVMGTFTATTASQIFIMFSSQVQYNAILLEKAAPVTIQLVTNTTPASLSVGSGTNVVFTAAFSNTPPITVQWQVLANGVTNNINTGVVNVTNNGVVSSTLTLTNVTVSNSGSYRLKAVNAANISDVAFSSPAPLTVSPVITWYAAGTYNGVFNNNSVLTYAGTVANEVYGVDFGGAGLQTTANGYTFDDNVSSGNMTVANNPSSYNSYMTGGATTGDPALDTMLTDGLYGGPANSGTLNNLTIGQAYTVLVLLDDTRGNAAGGSVFHVTDGVTVSPGQQYAFANGAPHVGGFIMGTFTAQATTQPLTILNVLGAASQYNAVLLEKGIAPPPPIGPAFTSDVTPLLSDVPVGAPMSFSVSVSGSTPLHYQWANQNGPIAGATNSIYSFNALAGTNSYHVQVSNTVSAIVSSTAVLIGDTTVPPLVTLTNSGWVINDNGIFAPTINGNALMLTDGNTGESGNAFFSAGQYVGGFIASFYYQANGGADGVTFCLQNAPAGTSALGSSGGGLGYGGIAPSAAFEMNIYTNAIHGGIGILVQTNGNIGDFSNSGYLSTAPVNIDSGDNIYVQLYYVQGVMKVLLIDPSVPATNSSSFSINLPATVGNGSAYIGLTGSDGGVASTQTVSNFLYSYTTPPIISIAQGASGQVVVSWPVSVSSLFKLLQSSSLIGPWVPATPLSFAVVGLKNQATFNAGGNASYYKLKLNDPNAP
ncbi:MAG: hypothetical protein C5B50_26405 [Verrucomicrobia bacterium]|nr:MAG: hypothetical protein C5B50_26405 [Verrucomicrobiota bacterium]